MAVEDGNSIIGLALEVDSYYCLAHEETFTKLSNIIVKSAFAVSMILANRVRSGSH